jgi:N-acetylmuramic acid 6-phosphate etherase
VSDADLPLTESVNERTRDIDLLDVRSALALINDEDGYVHLAVREAIPALGQLVDAFVRAYQAGGDVIFIGAGTSGRLGVMEAAECPPTFGTDDSRVRAVIAGGLDAFSRPNEGREDDDAEGRRDIALARVDAADLVIGLTASGVTPYARAAVVEAKTRGATTGLIVCNRISRPPEVDILVEAIVGPEVLTGSTRMKAATAQKLMLNMLTTVAMIQLGKVYQNLMVDLRPTNMKLRQRTRRLVALATNRDEFAAATALEEADGDPKVAILILATGMSPLTARAALSGRRGHLREALDEAVRLD